RVNARGNAGGGTVKIGGGPHGQDPSVRNAQTTTVAAGAVIDASATGNGNGGQVTVWSDTTTAFGGAILAQGGPGSGDGGIIETSSKGQLVVMPSTSVSAAAPKGRAGSWLLDPDSDVTITNSSSGFSCVAGLQVTCMPVADSSMIPASTINNALNSGTSVDVTTTNSSGTQQGNILVGANPGGIDGEIALNNPNTVFLILNAGAGGGIGGITVNSPITDFGSGGNLFLSFLAGGSVVFNNTANITGNLTIVAGVHGPGTISGGPSLFVGGQSSFTNQSSGGTISLSGMNALFRPISLNTTGAGGDVSLTNTGGPGQATLAASSVSGNLVVVNMTG